MYSRIIKSPKNKSFFLFGPRGTGKTTWLKTNFKNAIYLDLLDAELFNNLLARPERLKKLIPPDFTDWIIIDEVQRVPLLLHEVHKLIEENHFKFILTGSSARKLKQKNINLLAGRALTYHMYPLTTLELKNAFNIKNSLQYGHLPAIFTEENPKKYLESYISTYLREEIQNEGLTRNLSAFSRFLEAASFSQGAVLNISAVAQDSEINRKVVENYFSILEDLMIAERIHIFTKKAKRRIISHPKFYFFDVGIYRAIRPKGPYDLPEETDGAAIETLIFQELKAVNSYLDLGYGIFYWRTVDEVEVDFILYGEKGLKAIEVKRTSRINPKDLRGLKAFSKDYPLAKCYLLYSGDKKLFDNNIEIIPIEDFLKNIDYYLA
ncbi:ATP-binding protein [Candidatus Peregrinibacteria bacterium]|nr:ATP-binding protein [Candidatus Peregrinibacteria bacterium]